MEPGTFLRTTLFRKVMMVTPIVLVGLCFQNFSDLEIPLNIDDNMSKKNQHISATSVEGAAEELLRSNLPELQKIENRINERLRIRWDYASADQAEVQMHLLDSSSEPNSSSSRWRVSLVNDKFRMNFDEYDMACDYAPMNDLVTLRTNASSSSHLSIEHSGREQQSRVSWQLSW